MSANTTPRATYRVQLCPDFGFAAAADIASYLARLGVSHLYASPAFAARPGSAHGYDVTDMTRLNPELGGREGFGALCERFSRLGLGLVQDVVPNHAAFHGTNPHLVDVLELGPRSRFHGHYDIQWDHPYENINGKILAPFLGDFYARCLERGELTLGLRDGGFHVSYYDFELPISLRSYARVLSHDRVRLSSDRPTGGVPRLKALIGFLERLDEEIDRQPDFDYSSFVKEILDELYRDDEAIRGHLDHNITAFNGGPDRAEGFDLLDALLGEQFFRLSYWKVGTEELNYRRFFSINDLICLRVEEPEVLQHTHGLLFELIEAGLIQGVRVDHVDGLYDPTAYLQELRRRFPELYIVVEKILGPGEQLPADWPVQGTTGYDFLDAVCGLLVDEGSERELERCYRGFSRIRDPYEQIVRDNKLKVIERHMAGDIDNLALLLKGVTNRSREGNDLTMHGVRRALVELLALFPIYRTYVDGEHFTARDLDIFRQVFRTGQRTARHFRNEVELLGAAIERTHGGVDDPATREEWVHFIMRLQQYTGPVMAKGVEDSAFYVYNRLLARNDVGCEPPRLGHTVDEFHGFNQQRLASWPHAMSATATHDTKRGEDTRARIAAISWDAGRWSAGVARWSKLNRRHKQRLGRRPCPVPNDEYALYQIVLGAAPMGGLDADDFGQRLAGYLVKAAREGKRQTSWLEPDERYEAALLRFAARILDREHAAEFLGDFEPYMRWVAHMGMFASLTQTLLKLGCPGVPDLYQGSELWDLSLVDPDNRRPVDYAARERALGEIEAGLEGDRPALLQALAHEPRDGRIKLLLVRELLALRREQPALYADGRYEPLPATGERGACVVAFARATDDAAAVVVAPRLVNRLAPRGDSLTIEPASWGDTAVRLPWTRRERWVERFTGAEHPATEERTLEQLLPGPLPFAVLTSW